MYDIIKDEIREATQNDFDDAEIACIKISHKINVIKALANLDAVKDNLVINKISKILKELNQNA